MRKQPCEFQTRDGRTFVDASDGGASGERFVNKANAGNVIVLWRDLWVLLDEGEQAKAERAGYSAPTPTFCH